MGQPPKEDRELARFAREISKQEEKLRQLEKRLATLKTHFDAARRKAKPNRPARRKTTASSGLP